MTNENFVKTLKALLLSYTARGGVKENATSWAKKLVSLKITNDMVTLEFADDDGDGEAERLIVERPTTAFFADVLVRHENLILPSVPQSQYPEVAEWIEGKGEITREVSTGKVWCYIIPTALAALPEGWTWELPSGAVSKDVPKGSIAIVLVKS